MIKWQVWLEEDIYLGEHDLKRNAVAFVKRFTSTDEVKLAKHQFRVYKWISKKGGTFYIKKVEK